jgi:hypothetical protein
LEKNMAERAGEPRESDESIWRDAVIVGPESTKDAKIHLTLRLDPDLYKAVLAEKRAQKERTITATVERLLRNGLTGNTSADFGNPERFGEILRNLVVHSVVQDELLAAIARDYKPRSKKGQAAFDHFTSSRSFARDTLFSELPGEAVPPDEPSRRSKNAR